METRNAGNKTLRCLKLFGPANQNTGQDFCCRITWFLGKCSVKNVPSSLKLAATRLGHSSHEPVGFSHKASETIPQCSELRKGPGGISPCKSPLAPAGAQGDRVASQEKLNMRCHSNTAGIDSSPFPRQLHSVLRAYFHIYTSQQPN